MQFMIDPRKKANYQTLRQICQELNCKEVVRDGFAWFECNLAAKRAVLIIHGVTGGKLDMMPLAREYVERGWAVYCLDLPGHGKSIMTEFDSFTDLAHWLEKALEKIDRPLDLIVSNSYASAIVYRALLDGVIADQTEVILACPTPETSRLADFLQKIIEHFPEKPTWALYNTAIARVLRCNILLQTKDLVARAWMLESEKMKKQYTTLRQSGYLSRLLYNDNPYRAPLPCLAQKHLKIVMGTKDNVVSKKAISKMKYLAPETKIIKAEGAGHILHFEAYQRLIK